MLSQLNRKTLIILLTIAFIISFSFYLIYGFYLDNETELIFAYNSMVNDCAFIESQETRNMFLSLLENLTIEDGIYKTDIPDTIGGFTLLDSDGTTTVVVDNNRSIEEIEIITRHELCHVEQNQRKWAFYNFLKKNTQDNKCGLRLKTIYFIDEFECYHRDIDNITKFIKSKSQ